MHVAYLSVVDSASRVTGLFVDGSMRMTLFLFDRVELIAYMAALDPYTTR